jgi:hypothetical protein
LLVVHLDVRVVLDDCGPVDADLQAETVLLRRWRMAIHLCASRG